ncbi:MAG: paraquat-inducible protein A [Steroidobacteraceae bacterium]|jgi:paraquat-inducible protein A
MQIHPTLIACMNCDTLSQRPSLMGAEQATCANCGAMLLRAGPGLQHLLALSLAAAVLYIIANVFPVIGINVNGRASDTTLWGSVLSLADHATAPIAIVVALALIVVPALRIGLMCWILLHAQAGRRAPLFNFLMRIWAGLHPWSMVEVGVLAALVSIVKLSGLVHVQAGVGIWAMAALAVLLTVLAHWDTRSLWPELAGGRR